MGALGPAAAACRWPLPLAWERRDATSQSLLAPHDTDYTNPANSHSERFVHREQTAPFLTLPLVRRSAHGERAPLKRRAGPRGPRRIRPAGGSFARCVSWRLAAVRWFCCGMCVSPELCAVHIRKVAPGDPPGLPLRKPLRPLSAKCVGLYPPALPYSYNLRVGGAFVRENPISLRFQVSLYITHIRYYTHDTCYTHQSIYCTF